MKRKVDNLGDANSDLQIGKFSTDGQPTYIFVDGSGKKIIKEAYTYDPDVTQFMNLLDVVTATFKKKAGK